MAIDIGLFLASACVAIPVSALMAYAGFLFARKYDPYSNGREVVDLHTTFAVQAAAAEKEARQNAGDNTTEDPDDYDDFYPERPGQTGYVVPTENYDQFGFNCLPVLASHQGRLGSFGGQDEFAPDEEFAPKYKSQNSSVPNWHVTVMGPTSECEFEKRAGKFLTTWVLKGSTCHEFGIRPGDRLLQVNGTPIHGMKNKQFRTKLTERPLSLGFFLDAQAVTRRT